MDSFSITSFSASYTNSNVENENDSSPREKIPTFEHTPLSERAISMNKESKDPSQQKPGNISLSTITLSHENVVNIEVKPFNEIVFNLEKIQTKLRNVEYQALKFNENYNILKKDKNKLSDLKFLQESSDWIAKGGTVGGANNFQEISAYQSLRGSRKISSLEKVLDQNSNFRLQLNPVNGAFRDKSTGLYADLVHIGPGNNDYLLCFPGSGSGDMFSKNWSTNINQVLQPNEIPAAYKQAHTLAKEIKEKIEEQGGSLQLSGHSMGGGIANYVGLKLDIQSFCFNAATLGGGCQEDLKNQLTADRLKKQIHINQKGDIVTSSKTQNKIASLANLINKKTVVPKNIGIVYKIEAANREDSITNLNPLDRHFLTSFDLVFDKPEKFNIDALSNQRYGDTQFNMIKKNTSKEKNFYFC